MLKIVFMGTPAFAVPSLKALLEHQFNILAVITAPDRPAGRGQKLTSSAVSKFAQSRQIPVLQPTNLKDPAFVDKLKVLGADLFAVVAFRMLPEVIWTMPPMGTVNLHASFLPQYRGAAPINWVLINGEKETGVSTFFIDRDIDKGKIIYREKTHVGPDETAGQLHDRLMDQGAGLLVKTLRSIQEGKVRSTEQSALREPGEVLQTASKLTREDCRINWDMEAGKIFNLVRGLSPYPGAWTEGCGPGNKKISLKILLCETEPVQHAEVPGTLVTDQRTSLKFATSDGFIVVTRLQQSGKKPMKSQEFLRGMRDLGRYRFTS
jgi:methionyl-tRNA formyltransferase